MISDLSKVLCESPGYTETIVQKHQVHSPNMPMSFLNWKTCSTPRFVLDLLLLEEASFSFGVTSGSYTYPLHKLKICCFMLSLFLSLVSGPPRSDVVYLRETVHDIIGLGEVSFQTLLFKTKIFTSVFSLRDNPLISWFAIHFSTPFPVTSALRFKTKPSREHAR